MIPTSCRHAKESFFGIVVCFMCCFECSLIAKDINIFGIMICQLFKIFYFLVWLSPANFSTYIQKALSEKEFVGEGTTH